MVGKRRYDPCLEDECTVAVPDVHHWDDQTSKRCCGTSKHIAPGCMRPLEVTLFLDRLVQGTTPALLSQRTSGLNDAVWQCFAELNLAVERNFSSLPAQTLKGYHSFTRSSRAQLWVRFATSQGLSDAQAAAGPIPHLPLHLQLVAFILEAAFGAYPEATIIKYTFSLPPWLTGWAARWGYGSPDITLLAMQAYDGHSLNHPARTVFVPIFH